MSIENLFRGKRLDNGQWVYGNLLAPAAGEVPAYSIKPGLSGRRIQVEPDTVGRYIGVRDSQGVKIYEGDLIAKARKDRRAEQVFEVWWSEGCCGFIAGRGVHTRPNLNPATVAAYLVVGNIYDNPELLFDQAEQANWF